MEQIIDKRDVHLNPPRSYSNVIPDIIYLLEKWMDHPSSNVPNIQKRLLKNLKIKINDLCI